MKIVNFKVWDKKKQDFVDNEEFVIDQKGKLQKLYYEGIGTYSFAEMNTEEFEIQFNLPTDPEPKAIIVEDDKTIDCPSCGKKWNLTLSDKCECGAWKEFIPRPKEIRLKFIQRGNEDI